MATIVNNPQPERVIQTSESGGAGWAVAVVILIAVIAGLFVWYRYHTAAAPVQSGSANINVTLPTGTTGSGTTY